MSSRLRIGLLTPSSNTVMEPRVGDILSGIDGVTAHFGRFRVTQISMSDEALGQFSFEPQLAAADLLADARCDVIAWGGTSGGWLGPENDRRLCRAITEATGIPSTTSTLALLDAFRAIGAQTYGLATPYLDEVQDAIRKNFDAEGFRCVAERHLGDPGNFSFADYDEETVARLIDEVAEGGPEAIAVYCTNFDGPRVAPRVERARNVTVLDSIAVTLWHAMRLVGRDTADMVRWGRIFAHDIPEGAFRGAPSTPA